MTDDREARIAQARADLRAAAEAGARSQAAVVADMRRLAAGVPIDHDADIGDVVLSEGTRVAFDHELRLGADALSRMRFTRVDEDGS